LRCAVIPCERTEERGMCSQYVPRGCCHITWHCVLARNSLRSSESVRYF
jgi:hypothetical protein